MTATDQLLTKIDEAKERRKEQEKARREAEMSEIDRLLADAQKEYEAHQKTLNSLYCELNKRIDEHDTAPALGFQKPEITLQVCFKSLYISKFGCFAQFCGVVLMTRKLKSSLLYLTAMFRFSAESI